MGRTDILQERMIQTMPLPRPEDPVRTAIIRLAAAAVGEAPIQATPTEVPGHEQEMGRAIAQANLGAVLARVDAAPTNWSEASSATWRFTAQADTMAGAESDWLDAWGRILQVPRYNGEIDLNYRLRIANEVIAPSTTNMGLALMVDRLLGVQGTIVLEGEGFFGNRRLNDGHRMNNGGRLMALGAFGADSLDNTFVVITPIPVQDQQEQDVADLCDRKRAAGNRLLTITNDGLVPHITAPPFAVQGQLYIVRVLYPESGATYTWSATNGTIQSGQGTAQITVISPAVGTAAFTVTQSGGIGNGKGATKVVTVVAPVPATITTDVTEAPAGQSNHTASLPAQLGAAYQWTITNGFLVSGQGTAAIVFGVGAADDVNGAQTSIGVTATDLGTGTQSTGNAGIAILPYPRQASLTTGLLSLDQMETGSLTMGHKIRVQSISTNVAARVRLYATAAQRDADMNRADGTKIANNNLGLIAEGRTGSGTMSFTFWPEAVGSNGDTPQTKTIYYTITNYDAAPQNVATTINFIQSE